MVFLLLMSIRVNSMDLKDELLDKFLSSKEGDYGISYEYLCSDFPDEDNYQLAKRWIQTAIMFGLYVGQAAESLGMNLQDVDWE